jgi:hypothetical protein
MESLKCLNEDSLLKIYYDARRIKETLYKEFIQGIIDEINRRGLVVQVKQN